MPSYTTVARNPATDSENRIHSDDVARRHGFRGGLVPGVTVYGYIVNGLLEQAGFAEEWTARGEASVRFRAPCYEGDRVDIGYTPAGNGDERALDIEVRVGEGLCVTGRASVPAEAEAPPGRGIPWAAGPAPDRSDRPAASAETLQAGTVLGSIVVPSDEEALAGYLVRIGAPPKAGSGSLHPGMLLEGANWVLAANVVLPPWVHAGSEVRHHRAVQVGEQLEVLARVEREWQHERGRRFVELEVAWTCGAELVATGRHVAIWQLSAAA